MFESIKVVPTNLQFLKITLSINCLLKFWLERSQSSKIESNMSTDAKLILLKSTFLNEQLSIFISLIVKLVGVSFSSSASKTLVLQNSF